MKNKFSQLIDKINHNETVLYLHTRDEIHSIAHVKKLNDNVKISEIFSYYASLDGITFKDNYIECLANQFSVSYEPVLCLSYNNDFFYCTFHKDAKPAFRLFSPKTGFRYFKYYFNGRSLGSITRFSRSKNFLCYIREKQVNHNMFSRAIKMEFVKEKLKLNE